MPVHQPAWEARTAKTRADIVESALALFEDAGYDATTVDQIVASAGVARRTFFRYFSSKEAVLFSDFTARQQRVAARLRARPSDEEPLHSLIAVLRSMCDEPIDSSRVESLRRVVADSPVLRDRQNRIFVDDFISELTHILEERASGKESAVALRAMVISAVGCIEVATMTHLKYHRSSVRGLFDEAVEACRGAWADVT